MANAMTPRFRVSDFLAVVNQSLEVAFRVVEIEGEVASFHINHQKYVFFDLKDANGTVGCFMMAWQLRIPVEDGMKVLVRAVPKVTPWGKFSLTIQSVRPLGEGDLQKSFELLRKKLTDEGLFDSARKRTLPERPSCVAVITSTQSAAYADFMKLADERWGGVRFMVQHVQVQGEAAADQIIQALEYISQLAELPEVVVLIRGGGSADDLHVFNDERVVRAVAASRVPVLTGIGHEVDESLCDLAADVRAATPSHAAQLLLPDKRTILWDLAQKVSEAQRIIQTKLQEFRRQAQNVEQRMMVDWQRCLDQVSISLAAQRRLLDEYDPEAVLRRGYAIVSGTIKRGDIVKITTCEMIIQARIEQYEKRTNH